MHTAQIRQEIIDRVLDRRDHLHLFDRFEPNETALVVIDMQPTFVALGSPAEVPASRGIVASIQRLADVLRAQGVLICWVTHANSQTAAIGTGSLTTSSQTMSGQRPWRALHPVIPTPCCDTN